MRRVACWSIYKHKDKTNGIPFTQPGIRNIPNMLLAPGGGVEPPTFVLKSLIYSKNPCDFAKLLGETMSVLRDISFSLSLTTNYPFKGGNSGPPRAGALYFLRSPRRNPVMTAPSLVLSAVTSLARWRACLTAFRSASSRPSKSAF